MGGPGGSGGVVAAIIVGGTGGSGGVSRSRSCSCSSSCRSRSCSCSSSSRSRSCSCSRDPQEATAGAKAGRYRQGQDCGCS